MKARHSLPLLVLLAAVFGCEGQPDNGPPPVVKTQATVDAQIEKIRNDPNMPPEAKASAIRIVQSSFEASKKNPTPR